MRNIFLFALFLQLCNILSAQETELYEPWNYRQAVENGTRSRDGNSGPNYWQNHADYVINVKLDTAQKQLIGNETISYFNESPDTLDRLVLRLYQNLYKKGAGRDETTPPGNIHDGVSFDTFIIGDIQIEFNDSIFIENGTNMSMLLPKPLLPGKSVDVKIEWKCKIATEPVFRREGYYKDNAWFLGQFYPQIAEYDDMERTYQMNGWDWVLSHKGLNEFYNDFNNYKVSIEVPEGFYIWATGTQTNAEEVFTPEFLKKYKQALLSNETTHLLSEKDNPAENLIGNIWKFKADFVPDFAFGTAPNFVWDVVNVSLDEKDVYVEAAYPYNEEIYHTTIDIARQTIEFTSETDPGVVFPYSHASVFNGMWYGGMEYPMITNVAATNDTTFFNLMIFHEIVHNYHPFSMGFNEKRYQYMDEGLTEFFTSQFLMQKHSWDNHYFATPEGLIELPVIFRYMAQDEDAPLFDSYGKVNVFNVVYLCYIKAELAYYLFQEMVGYERFLLAYKEFIKRWQGKHPTPWDMFYTFNDALGENYNWFWNAWFFDYGYPDLGINLEGDQLIIERLGVGSLPVPVKLNIEYTDGTTEEIYKPMDIWKNGEKEITLQLEKSSGIKSVWLDTHTVPDIDERNNRIDLN